MISSARPSLKYSFSLSPLMFSNGRTAIDGFASSDRAADIVFERGLHLVHRRESLAGLLGQASPHDPLEAGGAMKGGGSSRKTALTTRAAVSPPKARVPESIS